ncbi:hypothetical protein [Actinocorallia longicatena]|uniref:Uncharacterized protein n=1 Tax=Actinocorallia longicatena TaxID=111803 RepID=A0ABP6QDF0_9ACTN
MTESTALESITVDYSGSDTDALDAFAAILAEADVVAEIRSDRKRGDLSPWTLLVTAPTIAFMTAMVSEAGKDTWKALGALRRRAERPGDSPVMLLFVEEAEIMLRLPEDLPDDSRRGLADLLSAHPAEGSYRWDARTRKWEQED